MTNRLKFTPEKREQFLELLRDPDYNCNVTNVCKAISITTGCAYQHRRDDEAFRKQWEEAFDEGFNGVEEEAMRRARLGVRKPVLYQGVQVNVKNPETGEYEPLWEHQFSDFLMGMMLKANRTKYKERHEFTGADGGPLTSNVHLVLPDNGRNPDLTRIDSNPGEPTPDESNKD